MNTIIYKIYYVKGAAKEMLPEGKHVTFLQASMPLVTLMIKTVASCCRKKCGTNQIASFVRMTKHHVISRDALWVYSHMSVTRLETSARLAKHERAILFL